MIKLGIAWRARCAPYGCRVVGGALLLLALAEAAPAAVGTYSDSVYGFAFELPAFPPAPAPNLHVRLMIHAPGVPEDKPVVMVLVHGRAMTVDGIQHPTTATPIAREVRTVDGRPAVYREYDRVGSDGAVSRCLSLMVIEPDRTLEVGTLVRKSAFERYESVLRGVLDGFRATTSAGAAPPAAKAAISYHDPEYGFALDMPALRGAATKAEGSRMSVVVPARDGFSPNVTVEIRAAAATLDAALEEGLDAETKVVKKELRTVSGRPAAFLDMEQALLGHELRSLNLVVLATDRVLVASCAARRADFDRTAQACRAALDSFRLIPTTPAAGK